MPRDSGEFNLWAFGDAHVGTDNRVAHRESLADAIRQTEMGDDQGAPPFPWDVAVNVGDMSGGQVVPADDEGAEVVRQYGALAEHRREDIYDVCGNHDRSGLDEEEQWWFRKWLDPTGENTAFSAVDPEKRPGAVEGTWERYSFRQGNVLFLMMSDINEPTQTIGRGDLGGNPAGVVRGETFEWWKGMVEANQDCLIVSAHHYMLKETTIASGEWEGMRRDEDGGWKGHYHGYKPHGAPKGASYVYFVDSTPDAQAFESYLAEHPGAIAFWIGGHTHADPDDRYGNKSHVETKWGVHFVNASGLTLRHGFTCIPMSRHLAFTEGSDEVRLRCYLHTDDHAPRGWYEPAERHLRMDKAFHWGA